MDHGCLFKNEVEHMNLQDVQPDFVRCRCSVSFNNDWWLSCGYDVHDCGLHANGHGFEYENGSNVSSKCHVIILLFVLKRTRFRTKKRERIDVEGGIRG